MKHSADWYSSGNFWTVAGVIIALAGIAITVWVTLRASYPKRRLFYEMPVVTPLLNAEDDMCAHIEVRRDGRLLTDPHVVEVRLRSQSRLDISDQHFNANSPLRLDVGAPIIDILKAATRPSSRGIPKVKVDGTALKIGPSLIGKHQAVSFFLLVDGPDPTLTCPQPPLIDVDIREQDAEKVALWKSLFAGLVTLVILVWILISSSINSKGSWPYYGFGAFSVCAISFPYMFWQIFRARFDSRGIK